MRKSYNIVSSGTLSRDENSILHESKDGVKRRIPIETVDEINIFSDLSITTKFLNLISQYEIPVHFFNYYGFYTGSFMPRKRNISGYLIVEQVRHYLDTEKRLYLAKAFVDGAIFNMVRNMKEYDSTFEEVKEIEKIWGRINEVQNIEELMSVEGAVRKLYYKSFSKIIKNFTFQKRVKRPPVDPVNTLISFLNSLMYTTVLTEVYKTHLEPTISYLHEPSEKRYSLALDIAEIFKPMVCDKVLFRLTNLGMIKEEDIECENDICYLTENGKKKVIKEFSDKLLTTIYHRTLKRNVSYREMIRFECYKLIRHVLNDEIYKPLKAWW
ncbi:type I-B CRISPR-associated endonuclease Cas1b [Fervidobacterium islandicum]|uniref:CRISPR-associated endonuclease Cas1 n=1 Tax=Fervidobacterium islandicum TaxID=2423 RepID=A0AAI8CLH3_FERIS|nr:type I-B CRISPR-associated endonuclease Cas1b [Fervidobacterium islandicum]AMW33133.1 type I-B CRISPR-associated endonuclease Cas1b [Fervidobacterium islandicum]